MKKTKTIFVQTSDHECLQVNISLGRKWNYWYIQPKENPIKLPKGEVPSDLKDLIKPVD